MVLYRAMYGDVTHLKNWSRWRPASGGDHGAGVFFRLEVVCCGLFAGRELPLVFLWRCDTPLVIHMDFKKIYIRDAQYIQLYSDFFHPKSFLHT